MPKNMWTDGKHKKTTPEYPGEGWYPVIEMKRVHGSSYEPYEDNSNPNNPGDKWTRMANKALASHAQANFEQGKR